MVPSYLPNQRSDVVSVVRLMKFDDPVKLGFQGFEEQGAERMSACVLQREVKNGEEEDPS